MKHRIRTKTIGLLFLSALFAINSNVRAQDPTPSASPSDSASAEVVATQPAAPSPSAEVVATQPAAPSPSEEVVATQLAAPAASPTPGEGKKKWQFALTPEGWIPLRVKGSATINGRTAGFNLDTGEIVDLLRENFKFLIEVHAEAKRERLTLFTDVLYVSLEDTRQGALSQQDISFKQGFFELGAGYTVLDKPGENCRRLRIEPIAGARIYALSTSISGSLGIVDVDGSKTWVDAFAGVRGRYDMNVAFTLFFRGDLGAGQGSGLTRNIQGGLEFHKSERLSFILGYRDVRFKYSDSNFAFEERIYGPVLAATYRF